MKTISYLGSIILFLLLIWLSSCNLPTHIGTTNPTKKQPTIISTEITLQPTNLTPPTQLINQTANSTSTPVVVPGKWMVNAEKLAVVFIKDDDMLEVYSQPGTGQPLVSKLEPDMIDITPSGQIQWIGKDLWLEINVGERSKGWVNAYYLTQQISSEEFCNDSRVLELLRELANAVAERDGYKLLKLTSPTHGLAIKHEWWNPTVIYQAKEQTENIFTDRTSSSWGIQDGSGLPLEGAFQDIILPSLDEVFRDHSLHCDTLEQGLAAGGTTGFIQWPFEFSNINYYSMYRDAPQGDDLNWRTWAIGVEYIDSTPYAVVMVQYHWEI